MENDNHIEIVDGRTADPAQLSTLFDEAYGQGKRRFLMEHGDWIHRGLGNRWAALVNGEVAGYRGVIPGVCMLAGKELPVAWAMNLYVMRRFRGLGLQRLLDQRVIDAASVRMSFPGELGATIYARQGYALRKDLAEWRMPISALAYWNERTGTGPSLAIRRALLSARVGVRRLDVLGYRPRRTELLPTPDLGVFEDVYRRHVSSAQATTVRSAEFLEWRYVRAPYSRELSYYLTGQAGRPTHYAVVRHAGAPSAAARVLDLFGDLGDGEGVVDLVRTIARDAARNRRSHVSLLASAPRLVSAVQGVGFRLGIQYRFRWSAADQNVEARLAGAELCWVLGDSDNDFQAASFR